VGAVCAKRTPSGEPTCTSTCFGPIEVQDSLVTPTAEPSQTRIGFGSAVIEAFFPFADELSGFDPKREQLARVKREAIRTTNAELRAV